MVTEETGTCDDPSADRSHSGFAEVQIEEAREEFYRAMKEALSDWARDIGDTHGYAEHIPRAPALLRLLENLALEDEVSAEGKAQIAVAMARFSASRDRVPEAMVGPCAYIDDVALAALVAREISGEVGGQVLRRCWPGDEDPGPVIEEVLKFARYAMGLEVWNGVREEFWGQVGLERTS